MPEIQSTMPIKGINQDTNDFQKDGSIYSYALNATVESFAQDQAFPFLSSSPSNLLCYKLKDNEVAIGRITIPEWDKTILAVLDILQNKQFLIEVFYVFKSLGESDIVTEECCNTKILERLPQEKIKQLPICTSKVLLETNCFNWTVNNPINFTYKITDCSLNVYFNNCLDEDRFIYFDYDAENVLSISNSFLVDTGTSCSPVYQPVLDCAKTKWFPDISYPCLETSLVNGTKEKGVYSYLVAYSTSSGIPLTSFKSLTQPFAIRNEGQGIKIKLSNISKDSRYKYILLIAAETVNNITTYHRKAVLSTDQTEWIDSENGGAGISIQELFTQYPFYESSCDIAISNDILFKSGLSEYSKFNLQPVVNLIELEWVSVVLKEGDYKKPEIAQKYKSLLRDEGYALGIEFITNNGEQMPVFPLIGRRKRVTDGNIINNNDTIQEACNEEILERWQVYNTAILLYRNPKQFSEIYKNCSVDEIYEYGDFGYYESTEPYPNIPEVWDSTIVGGENLCGKPIRHFKTPDHTITVHHSTNPLYDNNNYIFPIGIRIKPTTNIAALLDLAVTTNLITQEQRNRIIGFKLVRANRAGNKTIIAKGLLYDVWKYNKVADKDDNFSNDCSTNLREVFYPNYSYNDLSDDRLIAKDNSHYDGINLPANPQEFDFNSNSDSKTRYTFHSPDTSFTQPDLGSYLKLEAEVYGEAKGYFNISREQAEYKLLSEKHYNLARIFGQWMASTITSPTEESLSGAAAGIGQAIGSSIPGLSKIGGSLGGLIGGLIGTNIGSNTFSSIIFKNSIIYAQTEKILDLFRLLGNYRQYHYQHQSVGKYNSITPAGTTGNKIRLLDTKEYITEGKLTIQEQAKSINFNNAFRESSVYLKTNLSLPNTSHVDNSRTLISDNTTSYTQNVSINNPQSVPQRFHITATEGRFRLTGTLCNPYNSSGDYITEEPIVGDGGNANGEYNSECFLCGDFDLDLTTDCRFTNINIYEIRNLLGTRPIDYGDLQITSIEECDQICTNITEATVTYPCKCNEPTVKSIASFYSSIKNRVDNQYGSIYDIEWIDIESCYTNLPVTGALRVAIGKKINCNEIFDFIAITECPPISPIYNFTFNTGCSQTIYQINFLTEC